MPYYKYVIRTRHFVGWMLWTGLRQCTERTT